MERLFLNQCYSSIRILFGRYTFGSTNKTSLFHYFAICKSDIGQWLEGPDYDPFLKAGATRS